MNFKTFSNKLRNHGNDVDVIILKKYKFNFDNAVLHNIYGAAMGIKAKNLYVMGVDACDASKDGLRSRLSFDRILEATGFSVEMIINELIKLVNFKLIEVKTNITDNTIIIIFQPEKRINDIVLDTSLNNLFKKNLSENKYAEFFDLTDPTLIINTENVIVEGNVQYDLPSIEQNLTAQFKKNVIIPDSLKDKINQLSFTNDKLIEILSESIIEHPDFYSISEDLFDTNVLKANNIVNRLPTKAEFFIDPIIFEGDYETIFPIMSKMENTFSSYSPLDFYYNCIKRDLNHKESSFLQRVESDYTIPRWLINTAIYKSLCGKSKVLNPNYLSKILVTANENAWPNFEDAITYWNKNYKKPIKTNVRRLSRHG